MRTDGLFIRGHGLHTNLFIKRAERSAAPVEFAVMPLEGDMDTNGNLYRLTDDERRKMERRLNAPLIPLEKSEYRELEPMTRGQRKNKMRNKPCLCGSGKKFKKCCWSSYA